MFYAMTDMLRREDGIIAFDTKAKRDEFVERMSFDYWFRAVTSKEAGKHKAYELAKKNANVLFTAEGESEGIATFTYGGEFVRFDKCHVFAVND